MQDRVPTQNPRPASDEVDIREVFAAIGRFFSRIGNSFIVFLIRLRQVTKRYAWLIVACILAGAAIGFVGYLTLEQYYGSELTLSSRYYSKEMLKSAINELDQLAEERNYTVLARKLNISPEQAAAIRSFDAKAVTTTKEVVEAENLLQKITTNTQLTEEQQEELRERLLASFTSFKVITTFYNTSVLDPLEAGLVRYLKDNDYIQRRVAVEQENLTALRNKILREQERLERLKTLQAEVYGKLAESGQASSNTVFLNATEKNNDPKVIFQEDLLFSKELQRTNEKLELNRGLEVVSGFTPYDAPASLSLRDQLIFGALIGIGVAYLIILLIGLNRALDKYEAKNVTRETAASARSQTVEHMHGY